MDQPLPRVIRRKYSSLYWGVNKFTGEVIQSNASSRLLNSCSTSACFKVYRSMKMIDSPWDLFFPQPASITCFLLQGWDMQCESSQWNERKAKRNGRPVQAPPVWE